MAAQAAVVPRSSGLKARGRPRFRYLATQPFVAILGDPDHREMDRKRRLGALARVTHTPKCTENLLKPRSKGGVLPLPIGDNQPFGAGANMFLYVLSLDT